MCLEHVDPDAGNWELWVFVHENDGTNEFSYFNSSNERARRGLDPCAKLILSVEATSYQDAMQKRNDFMGWAPYKPMSDEIE